MQVKVDEARCVEDDGERSGKDGGKASIEASRWLMTRSNAIDEVGEIASWRRTRWRQEVDVDEEREDEVEKQGRQPSCQR